MVDQDTAHGPCQWRWCRAHRAACRGAGRGYGEGVGGVGGVRVSNGVLGGLLLQGYGPDEEDRVLRQTVGAGSGSEDGCKARARESMFSLSDCRSLEVVVEGIHGSGVVGAMSLSRLHMDTNRAARTFRVAG
jgi:hypothetical protein